MRLTGEAFAQLGDRRCLLLLPNLFVLLFIRRSPQSLPGQSTPQKVHEHMP